LQKDFLEKLIPVLERTTAAYAITGSIASNYWGIPWFTHDVDLLVMLNAEQARQLLAAFPEPYYASPETAAEAVRSRGMFNVIDPTSSLKADLLLHKLVWNQVTPSDRQLGDAAGIAVVQAGQLDLPYLRTWAARQGTSDVLEAILQGKYLKGT
jgi:hypothetical protein